MNLEAERAVLGSLLKDHELMDDCYLAPDDFSEEEDNRTLFKVLQFAKEHFEGEKEPFDPVLLVTKWGERLKNVGGISRLMSLRQSVPSTAGFNHYQQSVRADRIQREIQEVGRQIAATGGGDLSELRLKMNVLAELQRGQEGTGPVHMASILEGHGQTIMKRAQTQGVTGANTANHEMNQMSGGHQPGDLEIIAARPSMGKTQYVLNDMDAVTKSGWSAVIFSLEMGALKMVERLVSSIGGIKNKKIKSGLMSDNDWDSYSKAVEIIANRNLFIDDTPGATVEYVRQQVKQLKKKYAKLVVYVDYLQFLNTERKFSKNNERVGHITKVLKGIAREFNVCVVAISAVGRDCEKKPDKRPLMSDLRESGDIESDADVITFLYRDEYYNADTIKKDIVELIVAKGRDIGTGTFEMVFKKDTGRFINMTKEEKEKLAEKVRERERQGHSKR
ncbi:replicative DNA helicase [Paenibacillus sp. J23TS9]|uniref:replicative DNA helicase n=1 Tax=Paenibacillus sp. J23TS9 TaxID=2807193 RepID=UPI001B16C814|nr:DnaB-like helicase C-terminal domain-containing protein [Paenibacillus sp. J23TS9]GIP25521.1 replicative DNA helicase [Paenibacillus sp. J23TS9]